MTLARVVGIRFKRSGKVYYFDPGQLELVEGDGAVVETVRGIDYGEVSMRSQEIPDQEIVAPLKPVLRKGTEEDRRQVEENLVREKEALVVGAERIAVHGLDMRLLDVEYSFDGRKLTFYFSSDNRVDFRELVRDLASRFHARIELRQIGVRDEARMLGGLGPCGRPVCCKAFMADFIPVSIRMAKDQNISLNPTKISGLCSRLMCCLAFEHDHYLQTRKEMPKVGATALTPDGPGEVVDVHLLKKTAKVRITLPDTSMDQREYAVDELDLISKEDYEQALRNIEEHRGDFPIRVARPPRSPKEAQMQAEAKVKSAERRAKAEEEDTPAREDTASPAAEAPAENHAGKTVERAEGERKPINNHNRRGNFNNRREHRGDKPAERQSDHRTAEGQNEHKPAPKAEARPAEKKPIKVANLQFLDAMEAKVNPAANPANHPRHNTRHFGNKGK